MVNAEGQLALPWLAEPLAQALESQRGHALLLHAAPGDGALALALTLAQAWLCEAESSGAAVPRRPCGVCGSCRLVQSRVHPDLSVLLPETQRREHGWLLAGDKPEGDEAKRKPSRQIRIDEVRALIDWSTRTSSRGRGKVALLHPAEAMNLQSASALLKTLEEPPPGTRLVLTAADPALLLPTVRSRCQALRMASPNPDAARSWLAGQGIDADAVVLLAACSGRPLDAQALSQAGVGAAAWTALPAAIVRGQAQALSGWPLPRALDALQKFCHDAMARCSGAPPRYFPATALPEGGDMAALSAWGRELQRISRHDEHPWNEGLLLEVLVSGGAAAWRDPAARGVGQPGFATLPR